MPFDCGTSTATAEAHFGGAAAPIKCNRWSCEICGPVRQRKLIAQGMAGRPTAFITITHRRRLGLTREQAAQELTRALATVVLRFKREQKKPPSQRYILKHFEEHHFYRRKVRKIAEREDRKRREVSAYLWVLEAHKSGWPHMHILWRGRYVPQQWLSEQLAELLGSPICDVRRVKDRAAYARYVAAYCGKEPHRFGTTKRYSQTRNYQLPEERTWERTIHRSWQWTIRDLPIATIRDDWQRWGRQVLELGGGVIGWGCLDWDWSSVRGPPAAGPRAYGAREGGSWL